MHGNHLYDHQWVQLHCTHRVWAYMCHADADNSLQYRKKKEEKSKDE